MLRRNTGLKWLKFLEVRLSSKPFKPELGAEENESPTAANNTGLERMQASARPHPLLGYTRVESCTDLPD